MTDVGGIAIDCHGEPLPKATCLTVAYAADAILFWLCGWPNGENLLLNQQPERGALLPLRKHFKLFRTCVQLSCIRGWESSARCADIAANGFDILCVRELTGGIDFWPAEGARRQRPAHEKAFDTEVYHRFEIELIARIAFESARKRRHKVTSIDKSNVLQSSILWREIVSEISKEYADVERHICTSTTPPCS
ncbi:isocitrate/isopropylmalate family dehydrogenase [Shigella flexneri]